MFVIRLAHATLHVLKGFVASVELMIGEIPPRFSRSGEGTHPPLSGQTNLLGAVWVVQLCLDSTVSYLCLFIICDHFWFVQCDHLSVGRTFVPQGSFVGSVVALGGFLLHEKWEDYKIDRVYGTDDDDKSEGWNFSIKRIAVRRPHEWQDPKDSQSRPDRH